MYLKIIITMYIASVASVVVDIAAVDVVVGIIVFRVSSLVDGF